jgi:hypothetical protein
MNERNLEREQERATTSPSKSSSGVSSTLVSVTPPSTTNPDLSPLPSEEYVEQVHLFTTLGQRILENTPTQEVLAAVREEILATTKLPLAIDFLLAELRHVGGIAPAMCQLSHYFTPFQSYVMGEAENDRRRFDIRIALEILACEAKYRTAEISRQGLFLFQFETLCRNRLGYDAGLEAIAEDPSYDATWRDWILTVRRQIGLVELADLIFVRSWYYHQRMGVSGGGDASDRLDEGPIGVLFGEREGRIAWANRKKDPLLLFAALHRQLGYPSVPRTAQADSEERLLPAMARRVEQLEARLKLVEEEQRGGIDLSQFYVSEDDPGE